MWEEILKKKGGFKKLNYAFLKEVVLAKGREMKGEVLSADEYLQFQEEIKQVYSKKHADKDAPKVRLDLNRIRRVITRILKENNLLEVKKQKKNVYDKEGNRLGIRRVNSYYFI